MPTGWSVAKIGNGQYTVTHNLGLTSLTELGIAGNLINSVAVGDTDLILQSLTVNSFTVLTLELGIAIDRDWMFTAVDIRTL